MYYKHPAIAIGILTGVLVVSQGCQSSPPPVFPDTTGIHLSEGADIQGDDQTVQAVLSVFKKAAGGGDTQGYRWLNGALLRKLFAWWLYQAKCARGVERSVCQV